MSNSERNHWASLGDLLGAEPAEDVEPEDDHGQDSGPGPEPSESSEVDVISGLSEVISPEKNREDSPSRPSRKEQSSHWNSVAEDIGVEVPPNDEGDEDDVIELEQTASRPEELPSFSAGGPDPEGPVEHDIETSSQPKRRSTRRDGRRTSRRSTAVRKTESHPSGQDTSSGDRNRHIESEDTSRGQSDGPSGSGEREEDDSRRRRRPRRRRRRGPEDRDDPRGNRTDREQEPQKDEKERTSGWDDEYRDRSSTAQQPARHDADVSLGSFLDEVDEVADQEASSERSEKTKTEDRRPRKRRRRRRRPEEKHEPRRAADEVVRDTDDAISFDDGEDESLGDHDDGHAEFDAQDESNRVAPSSVSRRGRDSTSRSQDGRRSRQVPSWTEAVEILVSANLDGRKRDSGNHRSSRGRGGRRGRRGHS